MSESLMSVAGQLVGIPVEKYTGTNGITVDQTAKTIGMSDSLWQDISSEFTFSSSVSSNAFKHIYYSSALNLVWMNVGFNCTSTSSVNALTGPLKYFPIDRIEVINPAAGSVRFVDLNKDYNPNILAVRAGSGMWIDINTMYIPYGQNS